MFESNNIISNRLGSIFKKKEAFTLENEPKPLDVPVEIGLSPTSSTTPDPEWDDIPIEKHQQVAQTFDTKSNYPNILLSMQHLEKITDARLNTYFGKGDFTMPEPELYPDESPFFNFINTFQLTEEEYLAFIVALVPHIQPNFFENKIGAHLPKGGDFPEFGGIKGTTYRSMMPTGETVLFLLKGVDTSARLELMQNLFSPDNILMKNRVLTLEEPKDGEPEMSGRLSLSKDFLELCLFGRVWHPRFSPTFPAQLITTNMAWTDLVVSNATRQELDVLQSWLMYHDRLWADPTLQVRLKKGFRALFYGPPGTGKTLAATMLGNRFGKPVYRVDLSQVVSKYIGETEKNLSALFDKAENKGWILFFDEADALFGKRTSVNSSNDRYANQDVSFLLQRVEDYNGLVILASNFKNNLDNAFMRRFQAVIHFPIPDVTDRLRLWQQTLPISIALADDVNLQDLAQRFEITGASILNVVHIATLRALAENQPISKAILLDEIRKEYAKEGKTI
jgi:hypothetical protein